MHKLLLILLSLFLLTGTFCCTIDETELVLTFVVMRHGSKTPEKAFCNLVNYEDTLVKLTKPYGFGELTAAGMEQSYALGQFIKNRYKSLLTPNFSPENIFVRSTFKSRTILTALKVIDAIYSVSEDDWMEPFDWIPSPYITVIPKYDFNTPFVNCPAYLEDSIILLNSSNPIMAPFMYMRDTLLCETGFDMGQTPMLSAALYDLLNSQEAVGCQLSDKVKILLPVLKKAADAAISILLGNPKFIPLLAGVLLNEFIKVVTKAIAGETIPKLYIYSGHDINVYSLMMATQVSPCQGVPLTGSLFALELRKEILTGKYFILPIYVSQPGHPITYLRVTGCRSIMCEFKQFQTITSKYALDIGTWRSQCGWKETIYIPDCIN